MQTNNTEGREDEVDDGRGDRHLGYHSNPPRAISTEDWNEIVRVRTVVESWGLDDTPLSERVASLAGQTYGAKFSFVSGSPGYVGELYVLHCDCLGIEPMTLIRNADGELEVVGEARAQR